MNVSVVGAGYVGLITAVGLASKGHCVECVDIDEKKVELINSKRPPIFEEGLEEKLRELAGKKLKASADLRNAVLNSGVTFICVGTPCDGEGKCDTSMVVSSARQIGSALKEKSPFHVVVVKSTVVPGTTLNEVLPALEKESGKIAGKDFGVAMNPEFLREGIALRDFMNPDRIVIGALEEKTGEIMRDLYRGFECEKLFTSPGTAEMVKYASNSFLAAKISFINEIGNICKQLGIDANEVGKGMGLDHRISPHFLECGAGFGGSCFPKDVRALRHLAESLGVRPRILDSALKVNSLQPLKLVELAKKKTPLKGKKAAVLGLAFKPGTDDVRESPAIPLIKELLREGAEVVAADPQAEENMKKVFPGISYRDSAQKAVDESEIVFFVTAWPHFSKIDFKNRIVIDGRGVPRERRPENYDAICW